MYVTSKYFLSQIYIYIINMHFSPNFWGCSEFDFSMKSIESSCDIFQWVHLNGCPWSARTYKALNSHEFEDRNGTYKAPNSHEFEDRKEWALQNGLCRT